MITFKEMELQDIPYVCEIERQCFGSRTPENFEKIIKNPINFYVVAKKGQIVVGYFGLMIIDYECEILTVAVDSVYRRQGIGTKMMDFMFSLAKKRGIKYMYLEVNENNVPAINLYKKNGFVQSYVRKNYYGNESALILKKSFCD